MSALVSFGEFASWAWWLIPLLLILPMFFGEKGVWYSMPISDVVAAILTVITLAVQFREWKREGIN
jgi:Na+-driven multidrug efflux pump